MKLFDSLTVFATASLEKSKLQEIATKDAFEPDIRR
jgi:hypothetical protein